MANKQDFIIDKGADWVRTIYMRDENDAVIDLTGAAAAMMIKTAAGGTTLASISTAAGGITITGATGRIDLAIADTVTAAMATTGLPVRTITEYITDAGEPVQADAPCAVYAIELTYASGLVERILEGYAALTAEIVT